MISKQELTVNGMTCEHCAETLTTALSTLSGVNTIDVDVSSGRVLLYAIHPLSSDVLARTVREAGFTLTAVRERSR